MTLKSDAKFKEKTWRKEFGEFSPNHSIVWKFHSDGVLSVQSIKVSAKKLQRSYLSWHWTVMENLNKLWPCGFKTGMRKWLNFIKALKSLKICTLMDAFCSERNVSARKFQRNYVSWHWRMIQNLKENWLVAWKMTWGIW